MIVDTHTHIFPPAMIAAREELARRDPNFAELYGRPGSRLATAAELLRGMDEAAIDVSVALGFAWSGLDDCRRHNDYLLEAAAAAGGRIVPFCMTQPRAADAALREVERCAAAGARGIGELRPADQGYGIVDSPEGALLAQAGRRLGLALLFHVTEPVGHPYPGKEGLAIADFERFAAANYDLTIIGAHWAGGLPFYSLMPEVRRLCSRLWFDTAASSLLYDDAIFTTGARDLGAERILFGSDFPLLSQRKSRLRIEASGLAPDDLDAVLGGNARRLLGLP